MKSMQRAGGVRGFTRADLCGVLACVGLMGFVFAPALALGGRGVGQVICLDNLRRLTTAWTMYAEEQQGRLVGNVHGGGASAPEGGKGYWAVGWLTWDGSAHNTNTAYLVDPRYGGLSGYLEADASVFRCPDDQSLSGSQQAKGWAGRARSYSMNYFFGVEEDHFVMPTYRMYRKLWDMNRLSPAQAFLFMEEHPDSINDPALWHDPGNAAWVDWPGAPHEGGNWVTFADGHVERRVWTSTTVLRPVRFVTTPTTISGASENSDLQWLSAHSGELK